MNFRLIFVSLFSFTIIALATDDSQAETYDNDLNRAAGQEWASDCASSAPTDTAPIDYQFQFESRGNYYYYYYYALRYRDC